MKLLAIDPGPNESAYVVYDAIRRHPGPWAKLSNHAMLGVLDDAEPTSLAIEMVQSFGMAVGAETFETVFWVGRFAERWLDYKPWDRDEAVRVYRRDVKMHLCGSARAKDANVRQALIDRYGGKESAIGRKKTPGPLYGIAGDCWSALAVAVTVAEVSV